MSRENLNLEIPRAFTKSNCEETLRSFTFTFPFNLTLLLPNFILGDAPSSAFSERAIVYCWIWSHVIKYSLNHSGGGLVCSNLFPRCTQTGEFRRWGAFLTWNPPISEWRKWRICRISGNLHHRRLAVVHNNSMLYSYQVILSGLNSTPTNNHKTTKRHFNGMFRNF